MEFEWDDAKRAKNTAKHGVDFTFAARVFSGDTLTARDTRNDYGEDRFTTLGEIDGRVYVVVWTPREPETIRLITAGNANAREKKKFKARQALG